MEAIERLPREQIYALQEEAFAAVWPHIAKTPLYQDKLRQAGLTFSDVRALADLYKVPFSFKSDIVTRDVFERTPLDLCDVHAIYSSGGTSAAPTLYVWDADDVAMQSAVSRRILEGTGTCPSDLGLVLAPLTLPVMGHCMLQQFTAAGAGFVPLGVSEPRDIVSLIQRLPITIIATLPVGATRLLEYMRFALGLDVQQHTRIRQLQLGGDFLSSTRRQRLERGWHADCYDFYGISEIFGPLAGECIEKNGLHFAADAVYVEVLDPVSRQPVMESERGIAVYTTLWRKGSPLLRYWSDDYVRLTREPCRCGRTLPRLWYIGRTIDSAWINGKQLFARDVEEVLLGFPVGTEYSCEYLEDPLRSVVEIHVEAPDGADLPVGDMRDALGDLFSMEPRVVRHNPGILPRDHPKPKRLVGFPILKGPTE